MSEQEDGYIVAEGALRIKITVFKDPDTPVHTHILAGSISQCRRQLEAAIRVLTAELEEMDRCAVHLDHVVPGPETDNSVPAPGFKRYRSHKIVEAAEIIDELEYGRVGHTHHVCILGGAAVEVPENFFARGYPMKHDLLVRYNGGTEKEYLSWSPRDVFLDGYTEISEA